MARKPYPWDLTDQRWSMIEKLIPRADPGGRPRTVEMREVVNGILHLLRTGCSWRHLPHECPPWGTTHYYYRRFRIAGLGNASTIGYESGCDARSARSPRPRRAPSTAKASRPTPPGKKLPRLRRGQDGFDSVYAKTLGRKRHLIVDTLGLVVGLAVHAGDVQDRDGAEIVLSEIAGRFVRLKKLWADGGYAGQLVHTVKRWYGRTLEIVKRTDKHKFKVLPKRWIVERTFSWLGKYRRLSKDYESDPRSSEAMIRLAMVNLMIHRLQPG